MYTCIYIYIYIYIYCIPLKKLFSLAFPQNFGGGFPHSFPQHLSAGLSASFPQHLSASFPQHLCATLLRRSLGKLSADLSASFPQNFARIASCLDRRLQNRPHFEMQKLSSECFPQAFRKCFAEAFRECFPQMLSAGFPQHLSAVFPHIFPQPLFAKIITFRCIFPHLSAS